MLYRSITKQFTYILSFVAILLSTSSAAFISDEVSKAMDQANFCQKATQELVFIECMRRNNEFIRTTIKQKSKTATNGLSSHKKKKINQGIEHSIKSKIEICMNEQSRLSSHSGSDRRQEYCLYENMLEVLINIDRNIEIFGH
ncbi:MAG: hypothetical protein ABJI60_19060 [Kangiellaceae bacterium]|jgi:hypothetical protein